MISPSRGEVSRKAQIIHGGPSRVFHHCQRPGLCVYPAAIGSRRLVRGSCRLDSFFPVERLRLVMVVTAHTSESAYGELFVFAQTKQK